MKSQLSILILFFICVSNFANCSESLLAVGNENLLNAEEKSSTNQSAKKYKRIVLYEEVIVKPFSSDINYMLSIYQIGKYCLPIYNTGTLQNRRHTDKDILAFNLEFSFDNGTLAADRDYSFDVNIYNGDISPTSTTKTFVETCFNSFSRHYRRRNTFFRVNCTSRVFKKNSVVAICANTKNSLQMSEQTIKTRVSGFVEA